MESCVPPTDSTQSFSDSTLTPSDSTQSFSDSTLTPSDSTQSLSDAPLYSSDPDFTSSGSTLSVDDPVLTSSDSSNSSSPTPPCLACPSTPLHCSSSAQQCSSLTPVDHQEETYGHIEVPSVGFNEVGTVHPQVKTMVSQIAATGDASNDLRHSSVSLERPCSGDGNRNTMLLGLPNIGNTCFMNSALQCLLELPAFCREIQRQQDIWSSYCSSELLRCFAELHKTRMSDGTGKARILRRVKSCLSIGHEEYEDDAEQDAHEFLLHLLCQLKEEGQRLKGSQVQYICPVEQLEFMMNTTRTCTSCGVVVCGQENYNHLSLNLSGHLTHSLEDYFMPTPLECKCWNCSSSDAYVSTHFITMPRVLMLHVKRFWAVDWKLKKLDGSMSIPKELTLQGFCGDTVQPGARGNTPGTHSVDITPVVSGHYIADLVESQGSGWLCMDDTRVQRTDVASVLRKRVQSAYILFYVCSGDGEGDRAPQSSHSVLQPPPSVT
ncbi:hypothetical protein DPEC_G00141350 [Dallia pectoralis]|uniref:Uncharacterized protein n=1 Tax=Dallia pectoralis TaxID=75939 RepID=A0ACC2GN80_DALPE|nr:hypothetical protein DPEC_G00141350 [Dallia pectoralis]